MRIAHLETFAEWRHRNPEKWARVEGTFTRAQLRSLKFIDAQIHLMRERDDGIPAPGSPEARWIRTCMSIYLHVIAEGTFPTGPQQRTWVKNQRRGSLCGYQVAALMQIPGWQWRPRRTRWDQRVEELNAFRDEYGREPRARSGWVVERALAHWYSRQHRADLAGKLTPNQAARLEGEPGLPTAELPWKIPVFSGSHERWFVEFWRGLK